MVGALHERSLARGGEGEGARGDDPDCHAGGVGGGEDRGERFFADGHEDPHKAVDREEPRVRVDPQVLGQGAAAPDAGAGTMIYLFSQAILL